MPTIVTITQSDIDNAKAAALLAFNKREAAWNVVVARNGDLHDNCQTGNAVSRDPLTGNLGALSPVQGQCNSQNFAAYVSALNSAGLAYITANNDYKLAKKASDDLIASYNASPAGSSKADITLTVVIGLVIVAVIGAAIYLWNKYGK